MRYMIIVKATVESEAGVMPEEKLLREMGAFHEEMARAGILRDASGLKPSASGWVQPAFRAAKALIYR
jgi:hypothetical protein